MKQINTNMCKQGPWDENVVLRDLDFLITFRNFKRESRYQKCSKTPFTLRLCPGFTVGYNNICKLYFRNSTMLLFPINYSRNWVSLSLFLLWGVLGFQFFREGAGYCNLLWCGSLSGASFIVRTQILSPPCCPTPTQSLEESLTGLCLYLRFFSLLPSKKVLFYVTFSVIPLMTSSNLIKLICG